jgi:hypothetical protein
MKIVFYVAQVVVGAVTFVVVQFGWCLLHLPYFDVLAEQRGATCDPQKPLAVGECTRFSAKGPGFS